MPPKKKKTPPPAPPAAALGRSTRSAAKIDNSKNSYEDFWHQNDHMLQEANNAYSRSKHKPTKRVLEDGPSDGPQKKSAHLDKKKQAESPQKPPTPSPSKSSSCDSEEDDSEVEQKKMPPQKQPNLSSFPSGCKIITTKDGLVHDMACKVMRGRHLPFTQSGYNEALAYAREELAVTAAPSGAPPIAAAAAAAPSGAPPAAVDLPDVVDVGANSLLGGGVSTVGGFQSLLQFGDGASNQNYIHAQEMIEDACRAYGTEVVRAVYPRAIVKAKSEEAARLSGLQQSTMQQEWQRPTMMVTGGTKSRGKSIGMAKPNPHLKPPPSTKLPSISLASKSPKSPVGDDTFNAALEQGLTGANIKFICGAHNATKTDPVIAVEDHSPDFTWEDSNKPHVVFIRHVIPFIESQSTDNPQKMWTLILPAVDEDTPEADLIQLFKAIWTYHCDKEDWMVKTCGLQTRSYKKAKFALAYNFMHKLIAKSSKATIPRGSESFLYSTNYPDLLNTPAVTHLNDLLYQCGMDATFRTDVIAKAISPPEKGSKAVDAGIGSGDGGKFGALLKGWRPGKEQDRAWWSNSEQQKERPTIGNGNRTESHPWIGTLICFAAMYPNDSLFNPVFKLCRTKQDQDECMAHIEFGST